MTIISLTDLFQQYIFAGIYLNEKLNFYYHIFVINIQISARNTFHEKAIKKRLQHSVITAFVRPFWSIAMKFPNLGDCLENCACFTRLENLIC